MAWSVALVCFMPVCARAQTVSDSQSWSELRVYVTQKQFTAVGFLSLRSEEDFAHLYERHLELSLQRRISTAFSGAVAYRFITSRAGGRNVSHENRFSADLIPRLTLPGKIALVDRNRGELRRLNGSWSRRYRNRVQLLRPFPHARGIMPYVGGEIFWDSRFSHWSRWRFQTGATFPVVPHVDLEAAYLLQKDIYPRSQRFNVLYTSFHVRY